MTLDGVVRRLAAQRARAKDLARAYTYLAVAYYGLSQEQMAKARFLEAWRADPQMELSSREFPPRILRFLEEAAEEARKAGPATTSAGAAAVPKEGAPGTTAGAASASGAASKKGRSKTLPILLGVGAAAGVGVAVASGGGGGGSPTPAPVPTASVSSAAAGQTINCRTPVTATVTVINATSSVLGITGVRLNTAAPSGGCIESTFTYSALVPSVAAGQSATVFNGSLFIGGAGCCPGTCPGTTCNFQQTFTVLTTSGDLAAGAFNYVVQFVGCEQCAAAGSLSGASCPPSSSSLR